jgi:hypothetical protein
MPKGILPDFNAGRFVFAHANVLPVREKIFEIGRKFVQVFHQLLVLQFDIVVGNAVPEIGVVLGLGYVVLNRVLQVVHVNELYVELVVIMFHLFQKFMVGFACGGSIQIVAQVHQFFAVLTEVFKPLATFGQQRLMICCGNHNGCFLSEAIGYRERLGQKAILVFRMMNIQSSEPFFKAKIQAIERHVA